MKLTVKPYKTFDGRECYVINDWYWYHCGFYNTQEQAELQIIKILEEERDRKKHNKNSEKVYYELKGDEILRGITND